MLKNKDKWSALSMKERADLINTYITNGISDLKEMKKHYNSYAPGGPIEVDEYGYPADITPAVVEADYPRENEVWKRADASNADMVQRLRQGSSRATIQDWEDPRKVATHKMMSAGNYVVGNVQNINGQLFDFTDPKHGFENPDREAIDSAIERGDYIKFDTEGDARYFAEHYKKHYNSFDDGGNIDTSIPLKSRQQYLEQQRQQIIDAAIKNSYDREFPEIPYTLKYTNENEWRADIESKINDVNNLIKTAPYEGKAEIYRERLKKLEAELAKGYTPELCEGPTCIYTTTGNFGEKYQVAGNRSFRGNPEKYGFVEIGINEIKPGDVIQDFSKGDGIPTHALMFVGFDSNGKALYNYSDGRFNESAIQKDAYYPFINSSVHLTNQNSDRLKNAIAAYRFIGNEEDNINWNNDFVNYRKNYTDAVTKELKQVPKLQLPVFLENNNFLKLK